MNALIAATANSLTTYPNGVSAGSVPVKDSHASTAGDGMSPRIAHMNAK